MEVYCGEYLTMFLPRWDHRQSMYWSIETSMSLPLRGSSSRWIRLCRFCVRSTLESVHQQINGYQSSCSKKVFISLSLYFVSESSHSLAHCRLGVQEEPRRYNAWFNWVSPHIHNQYHQISKQSWVLHPITNSSVATISVLIARGWEHHCFCIQHSECRLCVWWKRI